jgi:hypothetical protein
VVLRVHGGISQLELERVFAFMGGAGAART